MIQFIYKKKCYCLHHAKRNKSRVQQVILSKTFFLHIQNFVFVIWILQYNEAREKQRYCQNSKKKDNDTSLNFLFYKIYPNVLRLFVSNIWECLLFLLFCLMKRSKDSYLFLRTKLEFFCIFCTKSTMPKLCTKGTNNQCKGTILSVKILELLN